MPDPRYELAYDFDPNWGLILSGGYDADDTIQTTVVSTKDGANFGSISPMPVGVVRHCLVIVDDETFFVAGGETGTGISADVYQYSTYQGGWYEMNGLSTPRRYPNCGKVRNSNDIEIVVAGGWNVENLNTVEIYNVETQQWRMAGKGYNSPQK